MMRTLHPFLLATAALVAEPLAAQGAPSGDRLRAGFETPPARAPLNEAREGGIRYFSGVASYRRSFAAPAGLAAGQSLLLDVGKVGDVAEVLVSGRFAGILWHAQSRLDIGKLVVPGSNRLEVRVANLRVTRLIGDAQPGASKIAFAAVPT